MGPDESSALVHTGHDIDLQMYIHTCIVDPCLELELKARAHRSSIYIKLGRVQNSKVS
jgi:hypothetical protein